MPSTSYNMLHHYEERSDSYPNDIRLRRTDVTYDNGRGDLRPTVRSLTVDRGRSKDTSKATSPGQPNGPGVFPKANKRDWLRLDTTDDDFSLYDGGDSQYPSPGIPPFQSTLRPGSSRGGGGVGDRSFSDYQTPPASVAASIDSGLGRRIVPLRDYADEARPTSSQSNLVRFGARESSRPVRNHNESRRERMRDGMADFFSEEVFQTVLRNPTTAHRFLTFCQNRACGENMEFLQKIDKFNRLLDDVTQILSDIHSTHTGPDAKRPLNLNGSLSRSVTADVRAASSTTLPAMEQIFLGAQSQIEHLLNSDIYPRFVKHQITTSATLALSDDRARFQGLGDCFCLTNPRIADNPIVYASDGFVEVTGYDRNEIVPRNCRFLQGALTDRSAVRRLRVSIDTCEETVELLLNYRKNGEPFWNLLYCAPLYNQDGKVAFFIGGQINCSTTIHSNSDILKVLSLKDDDIDDSMSEIRGPSSREPSIHQRKSRSNFFKSWKEKPHEKLKKANNVRSTAGMEGTLIDKMEKSNFRAGVEIFYTAYSKYLVMRCVAGHGSLKVTHYSSTVIDLLCLNLPDGSAASIFDKDIFKVLTEFSLAPNSKSYKGFKELVRQSMREGQAISLEVGLMTGVAVKKGWSLLKHNEEVGRSEEPYVTHWTPLKDSEGKVRYVVLTIAPK